MSKKKSVYTIPVECDEWFAEYLRDEPTITCDDDIIRMIRDGKSTGKVARLTAIARNEGHAPSDILPPNDILYYTGTRAEIAQKVAAQEREVELENGNTYSVREFIGKPGRRNKRDGSEEAEVYEDSGPSFVEADSEYGRERALHYLLKVVPGHVFGRLKQVAAFSGDVEEVGEALKDEIDRMVRRLT